MFQKTKTKIVVTKTVTNSYRFGDILCSEVVRDGVIFQTFKTRSPKKSHPFSYDPSSLEFLYYSDTSFLNNRDLALGGAQILDCDVIHDLSKIKFGDLENILCVRIGMDGNVYSINSPYPLSIWRHSDYIEGFANDKYNLEKLAKNLRKIQWVEDVKIEEIPYYNAEDYRTHGLSFFYKLPAPIIKKICDIDGKFDEALLFGRCSECIDLDPFGARKCLRK